MGTIVGRQAGDRSDLLTASYVTNLLREAGQSTIAYFERARAAGRADRAAG
jgi:hypothetical protein